MNQWLEQDFDYHAHRDALGSGALRLLLKSPYQFYSQYKLGIFQEETKAMATGTLIHCAILEPEELFKRYVVEPIFEGLTLKGEISTQSKEAKEKRKAWIQSLPKGVRTVTLEELEIIKSVNRALTTRPDARTFFQNAEFERPGIYEDQGIQLKIKPDIIGKNLSFVADLKTTVDCGERKFGRKVFDLRYDFQIYMQARGIEKITGTFPEFLILIAVEPKIGGECSVHYFEKHDLIQAEADYFRSIELLKKCRETNEWPMRQRRMKRVHTPQWFIFEQTEDEGNE